MTASIQIGDGVARIGGVTIAARPSAGGLVVEERLLLRPLSFGLRTRLVAWSGNGLAAVVLAETLEDTAGDHERLALELLALHLAGAESGAPGFVATAALVARIFGWTWADIDAADALEIDGLAAALAPTAEAEDGWTKVVFGSAPADANEELVGLRERLVGDLQRRGAAAPTRDEVARLERASPPAGAALGSDTAGAHLHRPVTRRAAPVLGRVARKAAPILKTSPVTGTSSAADLSTSPPTAALGVTSATRSPAEDPLLGVPVEQLPSPEEHWDESSLGQTGCPAPVASIWEPDTVRAAPAPAFGDGQHVVAPHRGFATDAGLALAPYAWPSAPLVTERATPTPSPAAFAPSPDALAWSEPAAVAGPQTWPSPTAATVRAAMALTAQALPALSIDDIADALHAAADLRGVPR